MSADIVGKAVKELEGSREQLRQAICHAVDGGVSGHLICQAAEILRSSEALLNEIAKEQCKN